MKANDALLRAFQACVAIGRDAETVYITHCPFCGQMLDAAIQVNIDPAPPVLGVNVSDGIGAGETLS